MKKLKRDCSDKEEFSENKNIKGSKSMANPLITVQWADPSF